MPVGRAPAYDSVETRFVVTRGDKDSAMDRALEQMEKAGVFSAAEYRYLARTGGGSIKVRVELFVDEAAARANWGKRHHPQALAMTQAFDAGDEGWIYRDQMAGVRVGRAIFEFRTKGAAPDLPGFGRSYAQFASGVLRR